MRFLGGTILPIVHAVANAVLGQRPERTAQEGSVLDTTPDRRYTDEIVDRAPTAVEREALLHRAELPSQHGSVHVFLRSIALRRTTETRRCGTPIGSATPFARGQG